MLINDKSQLKRINSALNVISYLKLLARSLSVLCFSNRMRQVDNLIETQKLSYLIQRKVGYNYTK